MSDQKLLQELDQRKQELSRKARELIAVFIIINNRSEYKIG